MIWQQPWAWLGALTIAVPIVIHLLGRRRPTPMPFPTLRFFGVSTVAPARRHRLTDVALLCVRMAILLAAAAALTQPWIASLHSRASTGAGSRAIVVDASASMNRMTPDGRPAIDVARERARTVSGTDAAARIFESADVAAGIASAADWLAQQAPPRDLTVISDFQRGGIGRDDLAIVPADAGIHPDAITIAHSDQTVDGAPVRGSSGIVVPHIRAGADSTSVTWTSGDASNLPVTILAAPVDRPVVNAAIAAASVEGVILSDRLAQIDVVLPGYTDLVVVGATASSIPINEPWMFDVVASVRRDATVAALSARSGGSIAAGAGSRGAKGWRLVLDLPQRDAPFLAAVIVAVARAAAGDAARWRELEPGTIAADELRTWDRAASPATSTSPTGGQSDGRWLWGLALMLLALEWWLRRGAAGHAEVAHARVA